MSVTTIINQLAKQWENTKKERVDMAKTKQEATNMFKRNVLGFVLPIGSWIVSMCVLAMLAFILIGIVQSSGWLAMAIVSRVSITFAFIVAILVVPWFIHRILNMVIDLVLYQEKEIEDAEDSEA